MQTRLSASDVHTVSGKGSPVSGDSTGASSSSSSVFTALSLGFAILGETIACVNCNHFLIQRLIEVYLILSSWMVYAG